MANGGNVNTRKQNCDCGIFAQDSWTMDRLTVNGGVRFDWFNNSIPGGTRPASYFAPAITFADVKNVPDWKNWNGRFGGADDLFGDGQTAVKASVGRYVANEAIGFTDPFNLGSPTGQIDYRLWTDLNKDGTVLNKDGTPQLNEIAASFNPNFGKPTPSNHLDPDLQRGKNWEYSAGVERQLMAGWSVSGSWYRRRYYDFTMVDNRNISAAADYVPRTFTAPLDARLPNGGGETFTIYQLRPGLTSILGGNNLYTQAPTDWRTWNGFEVIANGNLWRGGFMTASWTAGKSKQSLCDSAKLDSPNGLRFCDRQTPYRHQAKLSGAVPLPFDTMISGLFQIFQGNQVGATYQVGANDLGGPLNLSGGTLNVQLIEPGTRFYDATTDLQLRFSKTFTMSSRVKSNVYINTSNIFNKAAITGRNEFFGGNRVIGNEYQRPVTVQQGRAMSFGVRTDF